MWGGATFDTSMRFLQEDPWERLDRAAAAVPNILFQMLLRASNAVGYTTYPDNVVRAFVKRSADARHRRLPHLRLAELDRQHAARRSRRCATDTNAICEAAICYTGDILDPTRTKYSLEVLRQAWPRNWSTMGTHVLAIKDMAGLCKPYAAYALVKALREEVGVPIHFHTHDTSGINAASILRAADAGVDIVDAALASMSGMTSQPNLNSHRRGAAAHARATPGSTSAALDELSRLLGSRPRALLPVRRRA